MFKQEIRFWVVRGFFVLFFLFLISRLFFFSAGAAEATMSYLLYPFLKIHTSISSAVNQKSERRQNLEMLKKELDALYVKHDIVLGRLAQLQSQQLFIDQSREVVDFAARYDVDDKKIAKILFYSVSPQEDVVFVDGGVNKEFAKDDIVLYKNALVGRIVEVYGWYSKVALVTDRRCRVSAQVSDDAAGICCGKNNNVLDFCFVPHFKKVSVGDTIVSTGQGLIYPQGFALGIVESVVTDLVSHQIKVKPYFDIKNISYVYVFNKVRPSNIIEKPQSLLEEPVEELFTEI